MPNQPNSNPRSKQEDGLLTGRLVHLALPVRWSPVGQEGRSPAEMACTYDIHPHGARLLSARQATIGEMVMVERGRNKAICKVVWAADPESSLRGQFTVQCVEGKTPWDEELRQIQSQTKIDDQYQPFLLDELRRGPFGRISRTDANRRRRPRFLVSGQAKVMDGAQHVAAEVQELSEFGARISTLDSMRPGTDLRLTLNVFDVSLALKAQVKCMVANLGMGVEFQEIRRGDRPLLSYVLGKLRTRSVEDFVHVEVMAEPLAATAG